MLRLAFDFIITWRETRTRPNAYFQDYTVRLGGAIWDLKTDMENLFTVTSHSPQVLSQIMV